MIITWKSSGGTTVTFSKTDPTYILLKNYDGFATPDVNYKTIAAPFQDGVTLLDTKFAARKFSIQLMVVGPALQNIQEAVNSLIRLCNPASGPGVLGLLYEDGTQYYITASAKVMPNSNTRSNKHQLVQIQFQAHTPFWYTSPQAQSLGSAGTITFNDDLTTNLKWPFTFPSNNATGTFVNYGDTPAGATFQITGACTNPVITNTTTGYLMKFNITMNVGDNMVATTGFGNKTITYTPISTGIPANGFQYLSSTSTFIQMMPGTNIFTFTGDSVAAATKLSITWSDQYSGV